MPKTQPHINKRKWLEKRQDRIAQQYRAGQNWHSIVDYLTSSEHMPFALTEADFFKYCDFLLDDVGNHHKDENILLQQCLSELEQRYLILESTTENLGRDNELLKQDKIQLTAQCDEFIQSNKQLKIAIKQYEQLNIKCEQLTGENTVLLQENQQQKVQLDNVSERIRLHNEQVYSQAEKYYNAELAKILSNNFFLKIIIGLLVTVVVF